MSPIFPAKRSSTGLVRNLLAREIVWTKNSVFRRCRVQSIIIIISPNSHRARYYRDGDLLLALRFLRQRLFRFPADKVNDSKTGKAWRRGTRRQEGGREALNH